MIRLLNSILHKRKVLDFLNLSKICWRQAVIFKVGPIFSFWIGLTVVVVVAAVVVQAAECMVTS